jgi:microcompartment protein CcmK/EutM
MPWQIHLQRAIDLLALPRFGRFIFAALDKTFARLTQLGVFMLIAKVIGTTVSTIKDEKLHGRKLLILRQTDETGEPSGRPYVAVDTVDAGIGDLVLTAAGSSARQTNITKDSPVDSVIMSIIDSLEVDGKVVFRKS